MSQPKDAAATGSNFLRHIIERDLADGTYAGRRFAGTPGDAAHHAAAPLDPARIRTRFPPEPNGYLHIGHAKSITPQLRPRAGVRRHLPPALRRHQSGEGRAGVRRRDHRRRALARLRLARARAGAPGGGDDEPPLLRERLLRLHVPRRRGAGRSRQGLRRRAERRRDARQPRRLRDAGQEQPVPRPHAGREPGAAARDEGRRARRRRGDAAREDRHGEPEHQPARPGALPHQARDAPQHGRPLVHLPDVHLRASDRGRAREHHPLDLHARVRGPAAVLRLAARHACASSACSRSRGRTSTSSRASTSATSSRARESSGSSSTRRSSTAGTTRACRRSPACAGAATRRSRSASCASAPAPARPAAGPTTRASRSRCATTSTRRRRARWRCSTRCAWCSPTGPRPSATRRTASPAMRRSIRSIPELGTRDLRLGPELWIERDDFAEVPAKGFFRLYPRQPRPPQVRLRRRVHRLREGRRRQRHPRAGDDRRRHQERHARRRRGQGQGHADLARRATTRSPPRCASTTVSSSTPHPDAGGKDFKASLNPASKQVVSGFVERSLGARRRRRSLPVRAARLLRRRPRRPRPRPAGLQPHRDAARHLVALTARAHIGGCEAVAAGGRCAAPSACRRGSAR